MKIQVPEFVPERLEGLYRDVCGNLPLYIVGMIRTDWYDPSFRRQHRVVHERLRFNTPEIMDDRDCVVRPGVGDC